MDQFLVPQFLDVEDKIFGPITIRQFVILLGAALIDFIVFKLADFELFVVALIVVTGSAGIIAFLRINGQPFHYFLLNVVQSFKNPSRRIWRKDYTKKELNALRKCPKEEIIEDTSHVKKISYNRLRDLSLIVNTGGYYKAD